MQDESKVLDAFLNIPCQNRLLWRGIIDMLLKFAVTDIEFWKKVLYTTAGVHVLRRLLWLIDGSVSDYVKMCEPATFKIKRSRDSNIILPKTVHIEDRCCMGTVKIPIRFLDPTIRHTAEIFRLF
ncbi:hypothetical protein QE152_g24578 [Popillia japonica]|uniref:Uncharacterized protein n=1 Tax=Popillia japonica TaxID=7064 RepID=A0AAW1K537_POPJA